MCATPPILPSRRRRVHDVHLALHGEVKKGQHTFEVRAVDQAGNVGAHASDSWTRKKKK